MKKLKQRILSSFLALCIIATIVPSFGLTVGATIAENEAIYSVNQNTDGMTDNIIVASYNDVTYVMGDIDENGIAEAIPAVKSGDYGNNIVINETSATLFKVYSEIYRYSGGSYWLYRMITEDGYIVDNYGNDYENHKLTTMDKATVDASETKPYYDWRFDWLKGWYNRDSSYSIYLVADGTDVYFKLGDGSSAEGEVYITVDIFSKSCQHTNMQYVPAVSPTCKQDGCDAHWYCPACDANCSAPYFSDEDGLNGEFNPPVTMSYGAIDTNNDGICDDCGKNMPVFKKVTDDSQIVDGGKYIFVTKVGDKYYAAATGTEIYGNQLPAVEITPDTNGNFTFEGTTDAMSVEIRFANACTEWGSGIRYGFITRFNQKRSEFAPSYDGEFYFDEYDIRGAKYGFYMGLNSDGTARIHSAYDESSLIHSYTNDEGQQFTFVDQSLDESYTETPVYLYRLTDIGTVNSNSYEMTAVKSETDYSVYQEGVVDAEGGTNIIGVTDALTQTAINNIVQTFVTDNSISDGENVHINTGVNIAVTDYSAESSITFSLNPTAVVTSNETGQAYNILDSDFDGTTPMTVTLYTGGIYPVQIIHQKQDGTKEYFYPEYSEPVLTGAEKPFYELYDQSGNMYVTFTVTEYSDIKLLTVPIYDYDEVTPERPAGVEIVDNQEVFLYFTPAESGFYRIYDTNRSNELNVPCFNLYDSAMNYLCSSNNDNCLDYDFVGGTTYIIGTNFCSMGESWNGTYNVEVVKLAEPESINITTDTITGYEGCSEQLSVEYNPENSIQSSLIWNSSDTSVATVNDDGLLTLVAPGTATVTAATDSGLSDSVNVTVLEAVEILLDETKNGTVDSAISGSKFKFTPETDGIYQIEVRCNELVSTEITDSDGNYLNQQTGYNYYLDQELEAEKTYYINTTNFAPSYNEYSFEYSISVKKLVAATSIEICNYDSLSVYTGEWQYLSVIFGPENAATEPVTWSSSNENVAAVDYAGFVRFISAGTATITATSENGLTDSITFTVKAPIDIALDETKTVEFTTENDSIYYKFTPDETGIYLFELKDSDQIYSYQIQLFTEDGTYIGSMYGSTNFELTANTAYLIKIYNNSMIGSFGFVISKSVGVKSLEILSYPTKMDYYDFENYIDLSGLKIKVTLDNDETAEWTPEQGGNCLGNPVSVNHNFEDHYYGDLNKYINTTISCGGKSVEFEYNILPNPVDRIEINTAPTRIYVYGDNQYGWTDNDENYYFYPDDLTGLSFTVYYIDETSKTYTHNDIDQDRWQIDGLDYWLETNNMNPEVGNITVTFNYMDKSADYTVVLQESTVASIAVTKGPNKTEYINYYSPDFIGMELTITYTDSSTKVVTLTEDNLLYEHYYWWGGLGYKVDVDGYNLIIDSYYDEDIYYVASYLGKSCEIRDITFTEGKEISSIELGNVSRNGDGMTVKITYTDETIETLTLALADFVDYGDSSGSGYGKTDKGLLYYYIETYTDEDGNAEKYIVSILGKDIIVEAEAVMIGDTNGDGRINNKDLGLLMQKLNGWSVEISDAVADVNSDGKVNNKDYGLLMQYVNGWDVEIG